MAERVKFTMSAEQHAELLDACKPVPYLVIGGVPPSSPQENANRWWRNLASELGFMWTSVEGVPGDPMSFTAIPREG
jgi:hypothetical protein